MGGLYQRKYGVATAAGSHIRVPHIKAGVNDYAVSADWTPAAGDVKVSKDGGALANIGTLPSFTNGAWQYQLTGTELSAKTVEIQVVDSATKAIEDDFIVIETYGNASALHPFDLSTALTTAGIADGVWDEAKSGHTGAGSFGEEVQAHALTSELPSEPPTAAAIATAVLNEAITEPTAVFAWGTATLGKIIGWVGALARNKRQETATTQTLRNDADTANIATASVSDDGTTATINEWT